MYWVYSRSSQVTFFFLLRTTTLTFFSMYYHSAVLLLFRPFLKAKIINSPDIVPRDVCRQSANEISKLFNQHRQSFGMNGLCMFQVHCLLTACTIHIINIPTISATERFTTACICLQELTDRNQWALSCLKILRGLVEKWSLILPQEVEEALYRDVSDQETEAAIGQSHSRSRAEHTRSEVQPQHYTLPTEPATALAPVSPFSFLQIQILGLFPHCRLSLTWDVSGQQIPTAAPIQRTPIHRQRKRPQATRIAKPAPAPPTTTTPEPRKTPRFPLAVVPMGVNEPKPPRGLHAATRHPKTAAHHGLRYTDHVVERRFVLHRRREEPAPRQSRASTKHAALAVQLPVLPVSRSAGALPDAGALFAGSFVG